MNVARARIAYYSRPDIGDQAKLEQYRREFAIAKLERSIRQGVEAVVPPLTVEERDRLALILA